MKRRSKVLTARTLVLDAERRFKRAGLHYGHGTDNARDEAVFLVFHALEIPFDCRPDRLDQALTPAQCAGVEDLVKARLARRCPAAYLTHRMWFAGHEFYVDERVLIPRSPLAELLQARFAPWYYGPAIQRILDIGTGSGCIGIAAALAYPEANVDATDISVAALAVAARNVATYALESRLHLHHADLFPIVDSAGAYDLILANPPYVPDAERAALPAEYLHEPALALFAAEEGLALIRRIFKGAAARMAPAGILVFDAGGTWPAVEAAFPSLEVIWVDLVNGGDGIGVITQSALAQFALQ